MRIAVFHELHNGGARRAVNEFSKRLKVQHEVDLYIVDEAEKRLEKKFFNKIFFYKFASKKWKGGDWKRKLYKDTIELYKLKKHHKTIADEINKNNYDVAFIHPSKYTQAPFILRFLKIPKVYYCEETLRMAYEFQFKLTKNLSFYKRIYDRLTRFVRKKIDHANISNADLVLANSRFTQKNIKKAYGIGSKVLCLGVDTNFFKPEKQKKDIDVLYIGAKDETDGFSLLNDALKFVSKRINTKFHITYDHWISDSELKKLYNSAKIVVCLAQDEPFGLVPLETGACSVPVIVLNSGGYKETVIDNKTGFFVSQNPKDLAKKIGVLLSSEKGRARMGDEARKHVISNWTWEKSSKKLMNILSGANKPEDNKRDIKNNFVKTVILISIFLFAVSLRLYNLNEIGRTWDELEYIGHGYKLVDLIKKGDFNNSFFYTSYNHPPLVKYLYGITAHFDVEKYLPNGNPVFRYDLTYSRVLSALMFSLGVVVTVVIGWRFFSLGVGVVAGIILSMLPFSLGLSQLVTTESWKIFIYPIAIYAYIALLKKTSMRNIILAGIVTGVALQIKQSNALLVAILSAAFLVQYRTLSAKEKVGFIKKRILTVIAVVAICTAIFILIWPQALFHLKEIYEINQKTWAVQFSPKLWLITLSPPEVFFGRLMLTPNFYYIVYFFITIPIVILVLFFLGVFKIFKEKSLNLYIVMLWFLVPFAMSFYSWRQHGLRYIIEIYPAIALISAFGFDFIVAKFTKKKLYKVFIFIPVIIYLFITLWNIKPYYLDYFNEVVGGTSTVSKYNYFQTGWWGQGLREAGLFVNKNASLGAMVGLAISPEHTLLESDRLKYFTWLPEQKYDYIIVNRYHIIRDNFDDSLIRRNYELVYQVKADGATLVYIYEKK